MDSVRFGRALGFGARQAAKALVSAADAAASPKPSTSSSSTSRPPAHEVNFQAARSPLEAHASRTAASLGQRAARTTEQVRQTRQGIARGSKRFGEAVWGPFVNLSGVLWLELTGVFFGLFLLTALLNIWKLRDGFGDLRLDHAHQYLLFSIAMAALFGYFCFSSFVRAHHKQRRSR